MSSAKRLLEDLEYLEFSKPLKDSKVQNVLKSIKENSKDFKNVQKLR